MTHFFMKDTASVYRLSDSATDKETYGASAVASISCSLQPLDKQTALLIAGALGQAYRLFVAIDANVQVADKVVISGTTYYVNAKQSFNFGSFPHSELMIVKSEG